MKYCDIPGTNENVWMLDRKGRTELKSKEIDVFTNSIDHEHKLVERVTRHVGFQDSILSPSMHP